jgi:hypothetical protein
VQKVSIVCLSVIAVHVFSGAAAPLLKAQRTILLAATLHASLVPPCTGMSLALPFSLPIYTSLPATFGVCCLLSALVGLEYLVAVLQVRPFLYFSLVLAVL